MTEIQTFLRCRRQWSYASYNGESLGPIVPNTALSLGKTMHKAWAQWLIEPDASFPNLFLDAAAEELEGIRTAYRARIGAEVSDDELGPYYDGVQLGTAIAMNYERKWLRPIFEGYSVVSPEQQIEVPIPGARGVALSARLDGIIKNDRTGDLYILEHKTYAARPKPETLQQAFQFVAYEWAATQLNIGRIAGTAYDGAWKRPQPPRGTTFDDLFLRLLIDHPAEHLADVEATLVNVALDMYNLPMIYPNRRWEGCFDCAFEKLCAAQSRGEDVAWIKQHDFVRLDADKEPVQE